MERPQDLVVIGGGAGGLVVASGAAQLGLCVTLIERQGRLGGDCLHYGCVPSKTLIHVAKVASLMRRGTEFGLPAVAAPIDLAKVNAHVRRVIDTLQAHDDPERFRSYGCEVLFGHGEFLGPHEVQVDGRVIRGRRFVIATGSRPAVPPIEGLMKAGYLTNLDMFSLPELPRRLAVLGSGPVGIELAQAFARLGSRVTVIEQLPHILPQEDPEITSALHAILAAEGIEILTPTAAVRVRREAANLVVECSDGRRIAADRILVATGRVPNLEGLGLAAAGVHYTMEGITVDSRMRTSQHHIYACGDVCGPYPFTHVAEYQAGVVISNAVFRFPKKADYRTVPWVIFTDPELARVGLTEEQAREQGLEPTVLRLPFAGVDRAVTEADAAGLAKLVVYRGRIIGAHLLGPRAGELIHEIVLAMRVGARISDITAAIHAYPTLAQVHRRTVNTWYARRLFAPSTRRLVSWINRLFP